MTGEWLHVLQIAYATYDKKMLLVSLNILVSEALAAS